MHTRNKSIVDSVIHKTYIVDHSESFRRIIINRNYELSKYSIDFFVAGYKYNDGKEIIDLLTKNEPLELVHEHFNPYDPFAVAVHSREFIRLGYVPSIISSLIAYRLDDGKKVRAIIKDIRNGVCESDDLKIEVRAFVTLDKRNVKNKKS